MKRSRLGFGLTAAALAVLVAGVGSTVAADPGDVVIATQDLHRTLMLGDVAADNAIGVDYQKGKHSYLRWSEDGGKRVDILAACSSVEFAEAVFNVAIQSRTKELCTISQGARLLRRSVPGGNAATTRAPETI